MDLSNLALREFILQAKAALCGVAGRDWSNLFIKYRMLLHYQFLRGRILSTAHGVNVFHHIEICLNGYKWLEPSEEQEPGKPKPPENEYGKNFRAVIKEALDLERKAATV